MFGGYDDYDFDIDVLSSPVAARDTYMTTNTVELSNQTFFDDVTDPAFMSSFEYGMDQGKQAQHSAIPRTSSAPEFTYSTPQASSYLTLEVNAPPCAKPKPQKKQSMVFRPFSSFDATELTVKALKQQSFTSQKQSIFSW